MAAKRRGAADYDIGNGAAVRRRHRSGKAREIVG
jgi:hypothetical protein